MEDDSKSNKEQVKNESENFSEDRINFKLSLRKKKYNDILAKKRIMSMNPDESPWSYDLYLSKLNLPNNFKRVFAKDDELISTALNSIKSDEIINVKYGICLFKNYIMYFFKDENLYFNLNLNFVSDILNLLEKWGEKKEKQITFNLLYLLTNYSYLNNNKMISKILLSSKGYKIWDLCFDLQDYEIMSQIMWILSNITYKDDEYCYNLLKSNFFQKNIFSFYSNPTIINHSNETNENNLFYMIIDRGIFLFKNLLVSEPSSTINREEKYKLSIPIFNLILKYSESNSQKIYYLCIYSLCESINSDIRLINQLDNSKIISDILSKKFFSDEKIVLYNNRIIGDYIQSKANLPKDFYDKCINYQIDILFSIDSSTVICDIFWVMSNILHDNMSSGEYICLNDNFIERILYIFKSSVDSKFIKEISNFFLCLCQTINANTFIKLKNKGLVEIALQHSKKTFDEPNKLVYLFKLIRLFLDTGDFIEENFGGKNIVKEECDNHGLIDVLKKYENCENEDLNDIIENIINDYYE